MVLLTNGVSPAVPFPAFDQTKNSSVSAENSKSQIPNHKKIPMIKIQNSNLTAIPENPRTPESWNPRTLFASLIGVVPKYLLYPFLN
jgi:hypothetical protein